ncbi:MAG: ATP-binding cassette domain-containing protein [Pseudomonadota bacterium]
MSAPLLALRGLSGGYPPVSVFRDVNLTINAGETLGVFGPNGHGKTTLLKTVAGLLDPWSGGVYVDGQRLNAEGEMPPRPSQHVNYDLFRARRIRTADVVRAGVIYVMQGNLLFPEMTVEEVLAIAPRAAAGRPGTDRMLDRVHQLFPRLAERMRSKVRFLSGGERQMVSIAVGLLAMPRVLILDEPTLGLSPKMRQELSQAVTAIQASGVPLIVVDQNADFLTQLVDTLLVFDHGTVTRRFPASEMPSRDALMHMMFGQAHA